MSLFGAFWDLDPNPVGTDNFGNNKGLFYNLEWTPKGVLHIGAWDAWRQNNTHIIAETIQFFQKQIQIHIQGLKMKLNNLVKKFTILPLGMWMIQK